MAAPFVACLFTTFIQPRGWEAMVWFWFPLAGFFSGVFGLFTMDLPAVLVALLLPEPKDFRQALAS